MRLDFSDAMYLLQNEIKWCREHPDSSLSTDRQLGFMEGLRQAQRLLRHAEDTLAGTLTPRDFKECKHGYILNLCPMCFPDQPTEVTNAHNRQD